MPRIRKLASLGLTVALLGGACATTQDPEADSSIGSVATLERLPGATLQDLVVLGDMFVVVRAISEDSQGLDPSAASVEKASGSVLRMRTVALEVEDVLWTSARVDPPEGRVEVPLLGWVQNEHGVRPIVANGGIRIEVGGQYAVSLIHLSTWEGWVIQSAGTVVEVHDGRILGERREPVNRLTDVLAGLTIGDVRSAIDLVVLPPLLAGLTDIHPCARGAEVAKRMAEVTESD